MKLVIDNKIPFIAGVFEPFCEVVYLPGGAIDAHAVRDADALVIRTRTRCDAALLAQSRVRLIATATIGFDHIDRDYCREHGIRVSTAAGCNARGVAQWVFAALQAMGDGPETGKLGIIGVGNVGSVIRDVATGAGFEVICCDPPRKAHNEPGTENFVAQQELLRVADMVTVHVALDDTTRGMIGQAFFDRMKPGATFLNSSRGEVVDENALKHAIRSQHVRHTALDVWCNEPDLNRELLELVSLGTPHIAGYTLQGKAMGTALSVRSVARCFELPVSPDWYPDEAPRQAPATGFSWQQIAGQMPKYYDIRLDDSQLRKAPERFEDQRNDYRFRTEFF